MREEEDGQERLRQEVKTRKECEGVLRQLLRIDEGSKKVYKEILRVSASVEDMEGDGSREAEELRVAQMEAK